MAQAVFTALASARQVEVFRQTGGRPLDWSEIARATRSPELMAALLEREKELEIQGHLAENLALPLAVQLKIVDRAKAKPGKKCEPCFLYATPDDVLTELLRNVNLTPAALEAARALAAERPEASFASEVDDHYGIDPEAFAVPLAELAEKVRSAPTYDERQRALELYQQRKLRTW